MLPCPVSTIASIHAYACFCLEKQINVVGNQESTEWSCRFIIILFM